MLQRIATFFEGADSKAAWREKFLTRSALAYQQGANLSLEGCVYEPLGQAAENTQPCEYYCYLAGLVSLSGYTRILEIGTHYGGSIRAMIRGVPADKLQTAAVATVDTAKRNPEAFLTHPDNGIRRVQGDALSPKVQSRLQLYFGAKRIDLLFLDAVHTGEHTRSCFECYAEMFKPRVVIFDDIRLSNSMKDFWSSISNEYGITAVDVTEHSQRLSHAGFGALLLRKP